MSFEFYRKLPTPQEIKNMYPVPEAIAKKKEENDKEIRKVFTGESDKFILIIGPCSADNEEAVLDYTNRLKGIYEEVKDKIIIIPRVYTNKPRTTGKGYKGMLHQPDPEKAPDLLQGLITIRHLFLKIMEETGLPIADEMLYPENHRYFSDILSYVAVGARSVEDQQHRLTTSGMDIPVGMKNPTSGDLSIMLNSIEAAQAGHSFLYRGWDVETSGNDIAHAILRGAVNQYGQCIPNYHYEDLIQLYDMYTKKGFSNPAVIVDTNHSNSNKQYNEQIRIAKEIMHNRLHSEELKSFVKGLMVESYIEDGAQKVGEGIYGKSITDPCIGWDKTVQLIREIYKTL
ncbi:MAG: 3-deoxy-7-phosphoheptulonate synthase [Lachnospiraceae bacterium]|nr:3-deoxy-7-phosphoheptulonate synthase [Lachnospiraceae bacterium]